MRLELIRAALTGSDPVRAALARLISMASNELDTHDLWVHSRSAWDDAIANAEQALADEPAVPAPPADGEVAELVAWLRHEAESQHPGSGEALPSDVRDELLNAFTCLTRAAVALRAAADQVVPANLFGPPENAAAAQREMTREALLTLAAELES